MSRLILSNNNHLGGVVNNDVQIIKGASEFNAPIQGSKTLIIPVAQIAYYQSLVDQNPDYFKEGGIRFVKVLKNEDFGRYLQKKLEKEGYRELTADEILQNLKLTPSQSLITY